MKSCSGLFGRDLQCRVRGLAVVARHTRLMTWPRTAERAATRGGCWVVTSGPDESVPRMLCIKWPLLKLLNRRAPKFEVPRLLRFELPVHFGLGKPPTSTVQVAGSTRHSPSSAQRSHGTQPRHPLATMNDQDPVGVVQLTPVVSIHPHGFGRLCGFALPQRRVGQNWCRSEHRRDRDERWRPRP